RSGEKTQVKVTAADVSYIDENVGLRPGDGPGVVPLATVSAPSGKDFSVTELYPQRSWGKLIHIKDGASREKPYCNHTVGSHPVSCKERAMQKKGLFGSALALAILPLAMSSAWAADAPKLTDEEMEKGKQIYFERCAGCHGVLRKGATGKNLEPHWTKTAPDGTKLEGGTLKLGTDRLEKIISYGTEGGMVNYDDILTKEEINLMARYIQNAPPIPPEFSLKDMTDSWKLIVPVDKRPTKQMNKVNLKNVFAITLRDAGKLALVDGDTHKIWKILDTGYAVHISRLSASGRYVYTVGRDGLTTIIDMYYEEPTTVATVRLGSDARSVDSSRFKGFEDKYLIGGTYWPPQYSIMDGETLEPLKVVSTRGNTVDGDYHPEPRVASIVS